MKAILADAAAVGNATGRTLLFSRRDQNAYNYPNSAWKRLFFAGYDFSQPDGVLNLDARSMYFYGAICVSPAVSLKMVAAARSTSLPRATRQASTSTVQELPAPPAAPTSR